MKGGRIPVQSVRVVAKDEFKVKKRMRRGKQERNEGEISENWQFINDENKDYKNMPKTGIEPEWFINTQIHAYITFFGHTHAHYLASTQDRHLAFMQTRHL